MGRIQEVSKKLSGENITKNKYHIGIRLRGFSRRFLKEKRNFFDVEEGKYVPHITLIRPFHTKNEKEVSEIFEKTCSEQKEPMKFNLGDFDLFDLFGDEEKVVYIKVNSGKNMNLFVDSLEKNLEDKIIYEEEKISKKRILHVTAYIGKDYKKIINFTNEKNSTIYQYLLRTYLLKNKKILFEYDFFLKDLLSREEALDKKIFKKTIEEFTRKTGLTSGKINFMNLIQNP